MSDDQSPTPKAFLSDRTYAFLKYFTTILLPATGALYYGIAELWGFTSTTRGVNGTINLVILFLGLVLRISTSKYNETVRYDGTIAVRETETKRVLDFNFQNPEEIADKKEITLRVNKG